MLQALSVQAKKAIVEGMGALLEPLAPKASTQFYFETVSSIENLAINGMLLPDLIAAEEEKSTAPALGKASSKESDKGGKMSKEAKEAEKLRKTVIREGGKKGVEIEGASDMVTSCDVEQL